MSTPTPASPAAKTPFPQFVIAKSPEVSLEGLHERLMNYLACLGIVHQALWSCPAVVTSARDQIHGKGSKHYEGKAVDIRVSDVPADSRDRLLAVVLVLCDRFQLTVFDERNLPGAGHFHVEVPE